MKLNAESLIFKAPLRIPQIFPFLFGVIVLLYIGWSFSLIWQYPDDGIRGLTPTGYITSIDPDGPSANKLAEGDVVISVDGILLAESIPFYRGKTIGDSVLYIVHRNNIVNNISITLTGPSLSERLRRVMPLLVAVIFWLISMGVQAYAPTSEATRLLVWLFFAIAALITSGQLSNIGPGWNSDLYNFLAWIIGPLAVHFHLHFPQSASLRAKKVLILSLYSIGMIGGTAYLIWGSSAVRSSEWFPISLVASRLLLTISLSLVVGLLYYVYLHAVSPGVTAKIRIVILGGMISILPMVTLIFLPEILFHKPLQSYTFVLSWLGILPITYGYAIFRYHLIEIERHVNRGATYLLVFSVLIVCYLLLSYGFNQILPISAVNSQFFDMIMVMILATIIVPIYRKLQQIVDIVFYGGWYDYRSAVSEITSGLEQITDLNVLAETVAERIVKTLRLEDTCVFLCNSEGDFSVVDVAPRNRIENQDKLQLPILPRSSLQYLLKIGREEKASLAKALSEVTLSPEEHQLLNSEQVHLWVPIIGHGQVKGLLALGLKYGGDIFSAEDVDIMRIVAQQVSPVIENIHLVTQLRQYAIELETRVKERTTELFNSKERVEAILSSVGDGVFVIDLNGTISTVNKALEKQSGYKDSELIGQKLEYLFAESTDIRIVEDIYKALPQGKTWMGELINKTKTGISYDIQLTIAPVRDQSGLIVSYVGSQRDITHQKELDRLKDIFVADVSHELRTPTTNINLYLELLENAPPEKSEAYLTVLKEQGLLLKKLVEDILDLSRITVGKTKKTDFGAIDLNLIVEQVVTAHKPLAQLNDVKIEYTVNMEIPKALGDFNQLSRVLTNLVSNALQYTHNGNVCIKTFYDDQYVGFEVIDTGIGIDHEDINHIFERFYRGKQVRQSRIHGTGLGLAIVKEIVNFHGGDIQVVSEIGKGSTFTVKIPIFMEEMQRMHAL